MDKQKGLFRRALEALVEGRSRRAQRLLDNYYADQRTTRPGRY